MAAIQQTLPADYPEPKPTAARQRIDDYEAWVDLVRPTFVKVAKAGRPFLCWKVARDHQLPDPPDRDHDWGRFAAQLHRDGITRFDGFGFTADHSAVRRWRGTAAAIEGRLT